jgi:hypothetical protein
MLLQALPHSVVGRVILAALPLPTYCLSRLRVVSGIQHSELIANQVRSEQAVLLSAARQEQLAAEKAGYDATLAQAAADAKSKVRRVADLRAGHQNTRCRGGLSFQEYLCSTPCYEAVLRNVRKSASNCCQVATR